MAISPVGPRRPERLEFVGKASEFLRSDWATTFRRLTIPLIEAHWARTLHRIDDLGLRAVGQRGCDHTSTGPRDANTKGWSLRECFAYRDGRADASLLDCVGHPG
jgi:hypothetical protein